MWYHWRSCGSVFSFCSCWVGRRANFGIDTFDVQKFDSTTHEFTSDSMNISKHIVSEKFINIVYHHYHYILSSFSFRMEWINADAIRREIALILITCVIYSVLFSSYSFPLINRQRKSIAFKCTISKSDAITNKR